jgi:hypothetical protein
MKEGLQNESKADEMKEEAVITKKRLSCDSLFLFPYFSHFQALSSASSSVDCAVQPKIVFALLVSA